MKPTKLQPMRLTPIVGPLLLELFLGVGVGVIGTWLAAQLGDTAGAAFALTNHVAAMLFILFRVIGAGIGVVITQYLGGGQRAGADAIARASLGASTWMGGFTAVLAVLFATPLMGVMNAPAEVVPLAVPFLMWLAPAMLLDAWNASMSSVLRAHLRVREALITVVVMQIVHLALCWVLMRALGLPGFALALIISRSVGLALHWRFWQQRLAIAIHSSDWFQLRWKELQAVLRIGLPGAAEQIGYRLAFTVSVSVAGLLGASALATQAYVLQLGMFVVLCGVATGLAVEIVVGHQIGAGHLKAADKLVRRALASGLLVALLATSLMALAGEQLLGLFTQDAAVISLGTQLLWWTVLLEPGRTFNLIVINALRATGDARFPVMAGIASMVIVLAGGAWVLGIHAGLGLVGLWIAYAADEWLRGLIMWWRWQSRAWLAHARDSHRRVRAGDGH
ncbi:MATE family efflux transporter [Chitinimonas sp. BJYL2]|uniref:MATE family efflux transporter n=1 Tax=Chitinimonas sp. BJYL2 TaxID=2976696 RepID=UPI0022B4B9CF|nr:MATE family efflux transporter [Chitinimonas sp. BJYL2]